jgi:metal-responsive CopG/Arc/MetJ family transcriptional regulator
VYDMVIKRSTKVITVSVPPATAEDFERLAAQEGRNRSELFREMLGVYQAYAETRTFDALQRYGAAQVAKSGIRTDKDVERLIRESRA